MIKNRFLFLMMLTAMPFSVRAWENCGKINGQDSNCEYQISSDGVLTIRPIDTTKDAVMPNYKNRNPLFPNYVTSAPWAENGYETVTKIEIKDGITNIGNNAFLALSSQITSVVDIPNSVTKIGRGAFAVLPNLSKIILPKNLQALGHAAFQDDIKLQNIDLPEGLLEMSDEEGHPFVRTGITSLALPDSLLDAQGYNIELLTSYSNITTIYCSQKNESKCSVLVEAAKATGNANEGLKYETYEKYGNGYVYGGKFYANLGDIGTTKHIKKRIYTLDEANKITGKINRISIQYR